jgi:hypothetical protein
MLRSFRCALLLCLLIPAAALAADGNYLVKIGRDTLLLEKASRSKNQVKGEYVTRSPRSMHRLYTMDLGSDGFVKRFEIVTRPLGPTPGRETRATIAFEGDSATTTAPRGDSTFSTRIAAGKGAVPFVYGLMSCIEQLARQARGAGGATYTANLVSAGATQPQKAIVTKAGGDTLILYTETATGKNGPWVLRLDKQGRLVGYSGIGTAFQAEMTPLTKLDMDAAKASYAARPLGALSTRDTARVRMGEIDMWVDYGRPSRRGREIFGAVVPWDQVWRTGANAATQFHTSADVVIGDTEVPAGTYTLYTLPSRKGWKLILNKQTAQWGTEYHAEQDLARIDMRSEPLVGDPVEMLTISIAQRSDGAQLQIEWDTTRLSVPIRRKA